MAFVPSHKYLRDWNDCRKKTYIYASWEVKGGGGGKAGGGGGVPVIKPFLSSFSCLINIRCAYL